MNFVASVLTGASLGSMMGSTVATIGKKSVDVAIAIGTLVGAAIGLIAEMAETRRKER
ncbi:MAG: hypothetical protein IJ435_09190 [Clostridia bacterium]|nr:hypothetical protein [Clostridia bacterium]